LKSGHYYYTESNLNTHKNFPFRMDRGYIFLCVSGEATINIGLIVCKIKKNVEAIFTPDTTITILEFSDDFWVRGFVFSKEIYDYTILRLGISFSRYLTSVPAYLHYENHIFLKNVIIRMEMAELIHREKDNEFILLMQRNFVQNYFLYLYDKCQSYFEQIEKQFTRRQRQFYTFLSLLDKHIKDERNVAFYAEKLCITPRYFRKITANATTSNESPKELIDKRLILEIKVLLQDIDMTIQEIAYNLNFPDQSYLSRYFKLHTGISPSEYRKQIKL
jgi:AraC family transcriptional regulator, transcriptional activator of pobA